MIERIVSAVRQVWHDLEIEGPVPEHIETVLQSRRRVVLFLFAADDTHVPLVVVKMNRDPAQNHVLEQSVKRAQEVRMLLDPAMRPTVPSMKLLEPINGLVGAAEKALPGRPFEVSAARGRRGAALGDDCHAFADWLVHFQACARSGWLEITRDVLEPAIYRPLAELRGVEDGLRALVEERCQSLVGLRVPLVWVYGDAHPSNILLDGGSVSGVVDWEGTAPGRWPVFDWFQFTLSLAQELIKAQCPAMGRLERAVVACDVLIGEADTRLGSVLQQQTERFFRAIKLPAELVVPMYLVFLIGYYWFDGKEVLVQRVLGQLRACGGHHLSAGLSGPGNADKEASWLTCRSSS